MNHKIAVTAFLVLITAFTFGQKTELRPFDDFGKSEVEKRIKGLTQNDNSGLYFQLFLKNRNFSQKSSLKSSQDVKQGFDNIITRECKKPQW